MEYFLAKVWAAKRCTRMVKRAAGSNRYHFRDISAKGERDIKKKIINKYGIYDDKGVDVSCMHNKDDR